MRHSTRLLLSLVIVGLGSAADGQMPSRSDQALTIDEAALAQARLGVCWRLSLPLRPAEQVTMVNLVDEHVYALTDRGELFAIRAESGLMHWQRSIVEAGEIMFPITHALIESGPGRVVVTTPGWVALLDRETGRDVPFFDSKTRMEVPRFSMPSPPTASVVADAENLYASQVDKRFACYRQKDGFRQWILGADASGSTTPRLLPDRLLLASDRGRLLMVALGRYELGTVLWTEPVGTAPLEPIVGLTSEERRAVWPKQAGTTPLEPIFLSYEDLFFTGTDQTVYSIDPSTGPQNGQCRWRHALARRPSEGPAVAGDLVFQHDPAQGLLALDRATGRLRWLVARGQRLLARAGGTVCVLGTDGRLLVADDTTGNVRNRVPMAGARYAPTNSLTDAVYLADERGRILCLRNPEAKPLKRGDFLRPFPSATRPAQTRPATAPAPSAEEPPPVPAPAPASASAAPQAAPEGDVLRSNRP